jgi:hypothetical protein
MCVLDMDVLCCSPTGDGMASLAMLTGVGMLKFEAAECERSCLWRICGSCIDEPLTGGKVFPMLKRPKLVLLLLLMLLRGGPEA